MRKQTIQYTSPLDAFFVIQHFWLREDGAIASGHPFNSPPLMSPPS
ncbi:hypothetical protein [Microcoleus sp.]